MNEAHSDQVQHEKTFRQSMFVWGVNDTTHSVVEHGLQYAQKWIHIYI